MKRSLILFGLTALLSGLFAPLTTQAALEPPGAITFAYPAFQNIWNRADSLVANGGANNRSWLWGNGFSLAGNELYRQCPGGVRSIQYFDKARMEINNPSANASERFYVTNGLLVKELVSGRLSLGDEPTQVEVRRPADNVAIAGDPIEGNPDAPTYASFAKVASLANDNRAASALNGGFATRTLQKNGSVGTNAAFSTQYPGLKLVYYDNSLGHNIPEIFWNFFNSQGNIVSSNGQTIQDNIMDWAKDVGLPLTEAYWTKTIVSGQPKDVLVQAFERRVLTYTPSNRDPYRVEMGNVGLHYFNWRYRGGQALTLAGQTAYPLLRAGHAAPGINAEIFSHTTQVAGWMNDLPLKWVRQQVAWDNIEGSKGQRDFRALDTVVNLATANNFHLMLSVVRSPNWANPNGGMPLNSQDFSDFMTALVNRYKGKVAAYEIWNEQNLASEAGKPIEVGRYVQLLKVGYQAVKQADGLATVVLGGLSPVGFTDVNAVIDDLVYLKQLYAYNAGEAKKYFDVLGAHPGSNNNPPDTLWPEKPGPGPGWIDDSSFYFRRVEQLRKVMEDNGDGIKQVWLTEFGWDSTPTPPPGYEYAKQISEEQQAQYIGRAFEKGLREYPWMGPMLLWQLNFALPSVTDNPNNEKNGWGILRRDGSKRPSYFAVQQYAQNWQP